MLKGTGDGNVSPALVIDRGSVAQMVSNMVSEYVVKDGAEVTGEQKGIVIVAAKSVTFKNAKLAETVVVAPKAAKASVTLTGSTTAAEVVVAAEGAAVTVGKTASVESVTLDAAKAAVTVNGKITTVTVNKGADNANVTANQGAKIGTVVTAAAGTDITGAKNTIGTIVAEATATNVKVAASGAKIENKSAETIGKVAPGATGKAPGSGSTATDSGSSSSTHTGTYKITKDTATHGSFTVKVGGANAESANAGETVTVSAKPDYCYEVEEIAVKKADNEKIYRTTEDTTLRFTMPAEAVTVSVTFKQSDNAYAVETSDASVVYTVGSDTHVYTVTDDVTVRVLVDGIKTDLVMAGDKATVVVEGAGAGMTIVKFSYKAEGAEAATPVTDKTTFKMPAKAVTITEVKLKKR